MKTPIRRTPRTQHPAKSEGGSNRSRRHAADPLEALQARADASPPVRQLLVLQRQQSLVLQAAEGDTDAAAPAPPVAVMISVEDGKIGSFYFDDGRIRGTHEEGPADERGKHALTERYHIDLAGARNDYDLAVAQGRHARQSFNEWVSDELWNGDPGWKMGEIPVPSEMPTGPAPANSALFENFGDKEAELVGHHPSRGAAEKRMLPAADVKVLETAIELSAADTTASRKNRTFYAELLEKTPALAAEMRMPEEIDAETAEKALNTAQEQNAKLNQLISQNWANRPYELLHAVTDIRAHRRRVIKTVGTAETALAGTRDQAYRSDLPVGVGLHVRAKNAVARAEAACVLLDVLQGTVTANVANFFQTNAQVIKAAEDVVMNPDLGYD